MSGLDTAFDFIQPEFLNILFFLQKSIVIFPYVDVKHLRSLEIFAVGYNFVDLDSTALHNLREILELERYNTYSQNPSFFFITNVNETQLEEIMGLEDVHCVINCNEDVASYADGEKFIFYNKKNKKFLNFAPEHLEFEETLISSSKNISILQDKILKIRTIATKIYTELNDSGNFRTISKLMAEIKSKYWNKILDYTKLYYKIEIPDIPLKAGLSEGIKNLSTDSFSDEYDLIVAKNKMIGKEFMQLIHDYRKEKVNSANLSNEQLYYPLKLYDYLRNHHWKKGIDEAFLAEWVRMNKTKYILNKNDLADFHYILDTLKVPHSIIVKIFDPAIPYIVEQNSSSDIKEEEFIQKSIQVEKSRFEILDEIENMLNNGRLSSKEISSLQQELLNIHQLLGKKEREIPILPQFVKEKIGAHLEKLYFKRFLTLHQESDPFKFIIRFIGFLEHLNKVMFGKDILKTVPQKIKEFQFPHELEKNIFLVYKWRKKLAHPELSQKFEVTPNIEEKCRETYANFTIHFYGNQIIQLAKNEGWDILKYKSKISEFLTRYYFEPARIQNFFLLNTLDSG